VVRNGFDVGVHGVEYEDVSKMEIEYNDFKSISKLDSFGVRIHYVRYDDSTFSKMERLGYIFDSSEFNKEKIELKLPYKVGKMWEFPLHIMEGYILKNDLDYACKLTIDAIYEGRMLDLSYFTLLFHDNFFNDKTYPEEKKYYEWFINYCESQHLEFVSYRTAIQELERTLDNKTVSAL